MRGKKLIIPSLLVAFGATSVGVSISAISRTAAANEISWSEVSYNENYSFNDTLEIQDRIFSNNGESITASHVVAFPDGKTTDKTTVLLDQVGNYTVKYTALSGGKLYSKVEKFNVRYGAYYFDSSKSSAHYGKTERADTEGIVIDLAKDDTFHLTKHIDINNLSKSDLLVKGYISPSVLGAADFTALTFKFTDSVDPSIYLRCSYFAYEINSQGGWSFAGACGNDQQICGWLASKQQVYRGEGTGASMMTSFSGIRRDTLSVPNTYVELRDDEYPFQVSLDTKDMIVYGYNGNLICDLDSSQFFEKAWSGFPSGKADLTVSADGYSGGTGTIVLTDILGYDDLSTISFEDTVGPKITLNSDYEELPAAVVNRPYAIPTASAFDDYSKDCKVKTEVIYNYAGKNPTNVSVINGQFTPDKCGPYAIRYSSTDESNNTSYLLKVVNVYDKLDPLLFDLPAGRLTSCSVGDAINFEAPSNLRGGSGNKSYRIQAKYGDRLINIEQGETFVPDDIGEWEIRYIVTDYLNQEAMKSYTLNVSMDNEYTLKGTPVFLSHYVSGCDYEMPEINVFHKVNNRVQLEPASVVVTDSNGASTCVSKGTFKPTVTTTGDTIKFSIMGGSSTLLEKEAKCIIPFTKEYDPDGLSYSKLNIMNYFEGENINISESDSISQIGLKVRPTSSNGSLKFVNPLKNDDVSVSLHKISSRNSHAELDFKLIDAYNPNKTITAKAITDGVNLNYVYDGASSPAEYPFSNPELNSVEFAFTGKYLTIGSLSANVVSYDDGTPFNGFENKVYLVIEYKSLDSNDSFIIRTIGNHTITNDVNDKAAPSIALEEGYNIAHEFGERFIVPKASAYDVLSPNVNFTVTVTDENKQPVTTVDGVLLQNAPYKDGYEIDLNQYGQYHITYSASESTDFMKKGNIANYEIYITVFDEVPPVLTITSGYSTEVKVGEYMILPTYEVSDNYTSSDNIRKIVSVVDPAGKTYYLDNTTEANREVDLSGKPIPPVNAFKAMQAGTHKVTIMVVDAAGNITTFAYDVNVKEAK